MSTPIQPDFRGLPSASGHIPGPRSNTRRTVVAAILILTLWSFWQLGLRPGDLVGAASNLDLAGEFFARAVRPAFDYESPDLPDGLPILPFRALRAAIDTVLFAGGAMSLAVPLGLVLGFLGSTSWWSGNPGRSRSLLAPAAYGATRLVIGLMRSVHELLWAVLLLAAFGLENINAVIALAIPFTGVLAKIFSELIDETPRDAALALRATGASGLQVFMFGLVPRAMPDMVSYTFYRFECALRASAVLGFFGFPTLGFYIAASFENLYYGEVWTYLYALFLLIAVVERWSGAVRRRLVT